MKIITNCTNVFRSHSHDKMKWFVDPKYIPSPVDNEVVKQNGGILTIKMIFKGENENENPIAKLGIVIDLSKLIDFFCFDRAK